MAGTSSVATIPGFRELRCPSMPEGVALSRAAVFTAVDRPDRLELEVVDLDADPSLDIQGGGPLRPGRPIELWAERRRLFSGRVESCSLRMDRRGVRWLSAAYAEYESRRRSGASDTYYQLTDAEVACRIATELGLRPRVEATHDVHQRLDRQGDPLRFLRGRARRIGFQLAISAGELYFSRQVPSLGQAPLRVERRAGLIDAEIEDRGPLGRGGCLEVPGDAVWRPLLEFDLRGFGPAWEGRYRALRCRHYISHLGYRTAVEFLEEGTDIEGWKLEGSDGDA